MHQYFFNSSFVILLRCLLPLNLGIRFQYTLTSQQLSLQWPPAALTGKSSLVLAYAWLSTAQTELFLLVAASAAPLVLDTISIVFKRIRSQVTSCLLVYKWYFFFLERIEYEVTKTNIKLGNKGSTPPLKTCFTAFPVLSVLGSLGGETLDSKKNEGKVKAWNPCSSCCYACVIMRKMAAI